MKKQKVVSCPVCGTPCKVVTSEDFAGSKRGTTMHYEPVSNIGEIRALIEKIDEEISHISRLLLEVIRKQRE